MDNERIDRLLETTRVIAVVGCSGTPSKEAHRVPSFVQDQGYDVVPVNPNHEELLGVPCHPDLPTAWDRHPDPIQMVNVFRPAPETPAIARQTVDIGAEALWLQLGIRHPESRSIADEAGLDYVEDRCIYQELNRRMTSS